MILINSVSNNVYHYNSCFLFEDVEISVNFLHQKIAFFNANVYNTGRY